MQDQMDRTPGVYIRSEDQPPHEVDLLWSGTRSLEREERSPVLMVTAGVLIGAVITGAIFFLFFNKPKITIAGTELTEPVSEEVVLNPEATGIDPSTLEEVPAQEAATAPVAQVSTPSEPQAVAPASEPVAQPVKRVQSRKPMSAKDLSSNTYVVRQGDTLEKISLRYYRTATPALVRRIQRANKMPSPDRLSIGQRLVIPPKEYN